MPRRTQGIPTASVISAKAISVVRQHAAALMDAMVADHERSTGPWEIEWIVLPEAFCLMAGALKQSREAPQHAGAGRGLLPTARRLLPGARR